jgi:hypothetical protein
MSLSGALRARKQALPPHFLGCNALMGFALLNPSYGIELVRWVEHRETHQKQQPN